MTLPLCKCGHTAFEHSDARSHRCIIASGCQCLGFSATEAESAAGERRNFLAVANSPNALAPSPDAAERRRLALLQAAAVLLSADHWQGVAQAAHEAEAVLAEIERREAAREKEAK